MVDFTKIKSKYVLKKLKETNDQNYIEDLMFIEKWVTGETGGMGGAYRFHSFWNNRYPQECRAIYKELDPSGYKNRIQEEKKTNKEDKLLSKKLKEQDKREALESQSSWEEMKKKLNK